MPRLNRPSPATTGIVTTIMLTCALGLVAAEMWGARGELVIATDGQRTLSPVAAVPVQAALR